MPRARIAQRAGSDQPARQGRLEREVSLYRAAAVAISTWESTDQPRDRLLEGLASAIDRTVAGLWVTAQRSESLEAVSFWSAPGVDASGLEAASRGAALGTNGATIGRAWRCGAPLAIADVASAPDFARREAARAAGLRSWTTMPLLHGETAFGVVELFGPERGSLGEKLEDALGSVGRILGEFLAWRRADLRPGPRLTARERQVLQLAAQGSSARDSARALSVTPLTIKSHFRNIYEKLGVSDRAAAVAEGMRLGLIE